MIKLKVSYEREEEIVERMKKKWNLPKRSK